MCHWLVCKTDTHKRDRVTVSRFKHFRKIVYFLFSTFATRTIEIYSATIHLLKYTSAWFPTFSRFSFPCFALLQGSHAETHNFPTKFQRKSISYTSPSSRETLHNKRCSKCWTLVAPQFHVDNWENTERTHSRIHNCTTFPVQGKFNVL